LPAPAHLAVNPPDAHSLLSTSGSLGDFVALFDEAGLLVGFFLLGHSLLFTAGLLSPTTGSARLDLLRFIPLPHRAEPRSPELSASHSGCSRGRRPLAGAHLPGSDDRALLAYAQRASASADDFASPP
jgi:hypothetical protein